MKLVTNNLSTKLAKDSLSLQRLCYNFDSKTNTRTVSLIRAQYLEDEYAHIAGRV